MEIERKFLVVRLPDYLDAGVWTTLRQGYLAAGEGSDVRVREADEVFTLTAKSGSGLVREEHEVLITEAQFEALWPATFGRRIEKRRCTIPVGDLYYEVDVFEGDLTGLVVAEVEFCSVEEATAFAPPAWFGTEVTGDPRFSNALLATCGLPHAGAELS